MIVMLYSSLVLDHPSKFQIKLSFVYNAKSNCGGEEIVYIHVPPFCLAKLRTCQGNIPHNLCTHNLGGNDSLTHFAKFVTLLT